MNFRREHLIHAVCALLFSTGVGAANEALISLVGEHCAECHDDVTTKGDLDLFALEFELNDPGNRERWVRVFDRVEQGEMPPPDDAGEFDTEGRGIFVDLLGSELRSADREEITRNGRGRLRRLTRTEYEHNLRDLLQLPDLDLVSRLPEDRHSHGFTKTSQLLDTSRVQLAAWLDASEFALRAAVASGVEPRKPIHYRATGTDLFSALETFGGREAMFFARGGKMVKPKQGDKDESLEVAIFRSATWPYYGYPRGFKAPLDGNYRVKFAGRAVNQLPGFRLVPASDPQPMTFRSRQPSGADVSGDVNATGGLIDLQPESQEFETTIRLKKGESFEYSLLGLPVPFIRTDGGFFYDYPPMPPEGHRGAAFQWLEVTGPVAPENWPPESHRVLFGDLEIRPPKVGATLPVEVVPEDPKADAERLFRSFVGKAAWKPVPEEVFPAFLKLILNELDKGKPFAEAMLKGYQAFLCSGHFLYLTEPQGDDFAIASRLSYLLWNSRPDDALRKLAGNGLLRDPSKLRAETDRLIGDERFERFIDSFAEEWLDLRDLRRDIPDNRLYPEYRKDDYLVDSMERETRSFLTAMVRENLSVTTLVESDFTFANDRLARHYGLPRIAGSKMQKVTIPDWSPYGGILTQASILKLTANGTTTSPVVRGAWVMDKLLGDPPPPPPKSVPAIEPDIRGATTIRELLAKHTEAKSCAACHARFDPVGFALENFDVMGAWRDHYRGMEKGEKITGIDPAGHPFQYFIGSEIEVSGKLLNNEEFADVRELKGLLAAEPRKLARNLLHQLTVYATGTPVRFSEREEIESMLDACKPSGYRVRDLLQQLIQSDIFLGAP